MDRDAVRAAPIGSVSTISRAELASILPPVARSQLVCGPAESQGFVFAESCHIVARSLRNQGFRLTPEKSLGNYVIHHLLRNRRTEAGSRWSSRRLRLP